MEIMHWLPWQETRRAKGKLSGKPRSVPSRHPSMVTAAAASLSMMLQSCNGAVIHVTIRWYNSKKSQHEGCHFIALHRVVDLIVNKLPWPCGGVVQCAAWPSSRVFERVVCYWQLDDLISPCIWTAPITWSVASWSWVWPSDGSFQ